MHSLPTYCVHIAQISEVSRLTEVEDLKFIQRWYNVFRHAISLFLSQYQGTHQLGGPGYTVQIDESSFAK